MGIKVLPREIHEKLEPGRYYLDGGGTFHRIWEEEPSQSVRNSMNPSSTSSTPFSPFSLTGEQGIGGTGLRYDENKPRYDLIPPEFMEALAIHFMQATKEYEPRDWEKGMRWGTCFRAMMSHAWKWFSGKTYDVDSKVPNYKAHHMIAVAWNALVLYTYEVRKIGTDDRKLFNTLPENNLSSNLPYGM